MTQRASLSSSNPAVVQVDKDGLITANAPGSAMIMARYNGDYAQLNVTVVEPKPVSISVTPAGASIGTGATQQFTATGTYANNTTRNITTEVTWASSATAVASVSGSMCT